MSGRDDRENDPEVPAKGPPKPDDPRPERSLVSLSGSARAILEQHQRWENVMRPLRLEENEMSRMLRSIQGSAASIAPSLDLMRAAMPALSESDFTALRSAREFRDLLGSDWNGTRGLLQQIESQFRLPEVDALREFSSLLTSNPLSELMTQYRLEANRVSEAMSAMLHPWIKETNQLRSIAGFVELQGIGLAIRSGSSFDDVVSAAIRSGLGDFRDHIEYSLNTFEDMERRREFYVDRGLDTAITDLPEPAFAQSADLAGLTIQPPSLIDLYGQPIPPSTDPAEEEGFRRANRAHDWLFRLETHIRRFIDEHMSAAFGPDWPRHRLPNGLFDQWEVKRQKAVASGRPEQRLIAYADFTDYHLVICKRDNWREVFSPHFLREESVRESFQRLFPIRIAVSHGSFISQDDEIYLYAETTRLARVFAVSFGRN